MLTEALRLRFNAKVFEQARAVIAKVTT
jgi:hypothetical protein